MNNLVAEGNGITNVFYGAYIDYKKFDDYCRNGIHFVSHLKSNALVEVIEQYDIVPYSVIKKDQKVCLEKDGTTKMKNPLLLKIAKENQ